jgi:hypothetical protein
MRSRISPPRRALLYRFICWVGCEQAPPAIALNLAVEQGTSKLFANTSPPKVI